MSEYLHIVVPNKLPILNRQYMDTSDYTYICTYRVDRPIAILSISARPKLKWVLRIRSVLRNQLG